MSNDMKLIMENWRSSYVLAEAKKDLFEDIEYIQEVLGVEVSLNENNEAVFSEEIKKEILLRENAFTEFISKFNPVAAVKKFGKEVGDLFTTLHSLIKDPQKIGAYIKSLQRRIVQPLLRKIEKLIEWVTNKGMNKVAVAIEKIYQKMTAINEMSGGWQKALLITSLVIGGFYILDELKDKGLDMVGLDANSISQMLAGKDLETLQNILMTFFTNEMPKIAAKLFAAQAIAVSTGFAGFIVLIAPFIKVLNIAREKLKGAIAMFKSRVKRYSSRTGPLAGSTA